MLSYYEIFPREQQVEQLQLIYHEQKHRIPASDRLRVQTFWYYARQISDGVLQRYNADEKRINIVKILNWLHG